MGTRRSAGGNRDQYRTDREKSKTDATQELAQSREFANKTKGSRDHLTPEPCREPNTVDRGYPSQSTPNVEAAMLLCAPFVAFAQTSTSPNAAGPHSTVGSGTTAAPGKFNDQDIKTKLESLGYTQVKDIVSRPGGATAKAMKGDKPMTIVIDATGKVTESQIGP